MFKKLVFLDIALKPSQEFHNVFINPFLSWSSAAAAAAGTAAAEFGNSLQGSFKINPKPRDRP